MNIHQDHTSIGRQRKHRELSTALFTFLMVLTPCVPGQKKEGKENILTLVCQNPKGF